MKKVIILSLLGATGTGFLIFYFAAPETFMNMLDTLMFYLNQPLPLVGISVLALGLIALKIFASTSIGKKALNEIKKQVQEEKEVAEEHKKLAVQYKAQLEEEKEAADARISELVVEYTEKLEIANTQFDYFVQNISKVLEQIPNAKVREEAKKFIEGFDKKKEEIGFIVNQNYEMINEKVKELEGIIDEAKERINNQTKEE